MHPEPALAHLAALVTEDLARSALPHAPVVPDRRRRPLTGVLRAALEAGRQLMRLAPKPSRRGA